MNIFAVVHPSSKRVHVDECMDKQSMSYGKGSFSCIDCANAVYPRRGEKRAWHFSHYSSKQNKMCPHKNGGETLEHYKSKHWIAKHIACIRFKTGSCPNCFRSKYLERVSGSYVLSAEVEKRIPGTNKIADVLLVERSVATGFTNTVAAVEVFHTHEVDAEKMAECVGRGVHVLEVIADSVMQAIGRHGDECATGSVTLSTRYPTREICKDCVMSSAFTCDLNSQLYHWASYDEKYRHFCNALWWEHNYEKRQRERLKAALMQEKREREKEMESKRERLKATLIQERMEREKEMESAYKQETAAIARCTDCYEQHWREYAAKKSMDLKEFNQRRRAACLAMQKKRKAVEEAARNADAKRLALRQVKSKAFAFKELSQKRNAMLKEMQENDISEGKGKWNNELYWRNFHQVTKHVFGN
jgi:hypothetical protein